MTNIHIAFSHFLKLFPNKMVILTFANLSVWGMNSVKKLGTLKTYENYFIKTPFIDFKALNLTQTITLENFGKTISFFLDVTFILCSIQCKINAFMARPTKTFAISTSNSNHSNMSFSKPKSAGFQL